MKQHYIKMHINYNLPFRALRLLGLIFTFSCFQLLTAQNVSYKWARNLGGPGNDQGKSIAVDADGNIYTAGAYSLTADFDPGSGTSNLTSNGGWDIFISKLDADGNLVWAKGIGSSNSEFVNSICVDGAGNVYITGRFTGTVDFDPGVGTYNLTSAAGYDLFILKLNPMGNFAWAKSIGGVSSDQGYAVRADASGNIYTLGHFAGTVDFDPGTATNNISSTSGSYDVFILKLNNAGNFVWAKSFGGTSNDHGYDIQLDQAGNIYSTGSFRNTADFDPGAGVSNLSSVNGAQDVFISKLDAAGNFVWAKGFGGTGDDVAYSLALDKMGNIFTSGEFSETANFNPNSGTSNLTAFGSADGFISKLNASGNFLWAKKIGGTSFDRARSIVADAVGNVYITGEYRGTADFDPGSGTSNFTSLGHYDMFIVQLNSLGNYIWAQSYGRNLEDKGAAIHMDKSGNVYATGHFMVSVFFNPGSSSFISSKGGSDVFVLKLTCAPTTSTHTVTACNKYIFNGITYTANNTTATDTLTNFLGCDSIITLDLTINNIDVSTTLNINTISANLSGASYQWINCANGAPIAGETNSIFTATSNGSYAVIVSDGNCTDTSNCVAVNRVGTEPLESAQGKYQLFPNPANSHVRLTNFNSKINRIEILDINGKELIFYIPGTPEIDISSLKNGIYFVRIEQDGHRIMRKLVKE